MKFKECHKIEQFSMKYKVSLVIEVSLWAHQKYWQQKKQKNKRRPLCFFSIELISKSIMKE